MVRASFVALCASLIACGEGGDLGVNPIDSDVGGRGWPDNTGGTPKPPGTGTPIDPGGGGSEPAEKAFQPAFHQALRWSMSTGGVATLRMRVPVHRDGERLKVTFRSGDGSLTLLRANVALAGANGSLASDPVALTFAGREGAQVGARTRFTSDPVPFDVKAGDELAVTFEVNGALAAASILNFPGGFARSGNLSQLTGALGGNAHPRAVGLATVYVEGPKSRAAVAIGDSITEGYVSGATVSGTSLSAGYLTARDDYRNAWNAVASSLLGGPVVNAGVSGQGTYDAQLNLAEEVLALEGLTDCVVLLGTNDLGAGAVATIQTRLQKIFDTLAPRCRVWAGTLLPKERTSRGDLSQVQSERKQLNAWLRNDARVYSVIDFEAATRATDSVDRFYPGYGEDGIHPSVAGQGAMGRAAANALVEDPNGASLAQAPR